MGGEIDYVSKKPFPKEWQPRTYDELWRSRLIAVRQLEFLGKGEDEAAAAARGELLGSVLLLAREGQRNQAVSVLKDFAPRTDDERRLLLDAAQRLCSDGAEALTNDEKTELKTIIGRAFGATYFDHLRRWVGKRIHSDFDLNSPGDPYKEADQREIELAEEGYSKGLSNGEIEWLVSPEAENVWIFGRRLGELDAARTYLDVIVALSPANLNCMLLSSYLVGLENRDGRDAGDAILDKLAETAPTLAFVATWRGTATAASGRRIFQLMRFGHVEPYFYLALMYGGWVASLPVRTGQEIVSLDVGD